MDGWVHPSHDERYHDPSEWFRHLFRNWYDCRGRFPEQLCEWPVQFYHPWSWRWYEIASYHTCEVQEVGRAWGWQDGEEERAAVYLRDLGVSLEELWFADLTDDR